MRREEAAQLDMRIEDAFNNVLYTAARIATDQKNIAEVFSFASPPADVVEIVCYFTAFKTNTALRKVNWDFAKKSTTIRSRTANFADIDIDNLSPKQL